MQYISLGNRFESARLGGLSTWEWRRVDRRSRGRNEVLGNEGVVAKQGSSLGKCGNARSFELAAVGVMIASGREDTGGVGGGEGRQLRCRVGFEYR